MKYKLIKLLCRFASFLNRKSCSFLKWTQRLHNKNCPSLGVLVTTTGRARSRLIKEEVKNNHPLYQIINKDEA